MRWNPDTGKFEGQHSMPKQETGSQSYKAGEMPDWVKDMMPEGAAEEIKGVDVITFQMNGEYGKVKEAALMRLLELVQDTVNESSKSVHDQSKEISFLKRSLCEVAQLLAETSSNLIALQKEINDIQGEG